MFLKFSIINIHSIEVVMFNMKNVLLKIMQFAYIHLFQKFVFHIFLNFVLYFPINIILVTTRDNSVGYILKAPEWTPVTTCLKQVNKCFSGHLQHHSKGPFPFAREMVLQKWMGVFPYTPVAYPWVRSRISESVSERFFQ